MTDFSRTVRNMTQLGYDVKTFATAEEASAYLNEAYDGIKIGIGGSKTVDEMGLYDSLRAHNEVYWHWKEEGPEEVAFRKMEHSDVYISSANAIAETGEIVNVDGTGNRLASTIFGHKKVVFVVGRNKLCPDEQAAVHRVRQEVCPRRANDWDIGTPCVKDGTGGTKCYNCRHPDRICRAMLIIWMPTLDTDYEIILIDEDLGM